MTAPVTPRDDRAGFTLVEVLVAVVLLGFGVVALVGSAAMVTRLLGDGRRLTTATAVAQQRIETLRQLARGRTTPCTATGFASGGPVTTQGVTEQWTVTTPGGNTNVRNLSVTVTVRHPRGTSSHTMSTVVSCL